MKTKVLLSVAGLAACGASDAQVRPELQTAQFSGQVHQAVRATAITGLTVDGQYVYGQTIELGQGNANRITGTVAYDSAQLADTDGDGLDLDPVCADLAPHSLSGPSNRYWFGIGFSWQSYAEDIIPAAGTEGGIITEFVVNGSNALCDGGVRVLWTRGDGGDGLGPLNGGLYPSSKAQAMLWGTYAMQAGPGGCTFADGFGAGDSDGTIWGEGEDICGDGLGGWSVGAPSGNEAVDEQYDTSFDIGDWAGGFVPDFANALGVAIRINVVGGPVGEDCCDINESGTCTAADFSAWVAAFNAQSPRCDVNQSGTCTAADFSAWVAAFNASNSGNPQTCTF